MGLRSGIAIVHADAEIRRAVDDAYDGRDEVAVDAPETGLNVVECAACIVQSKRQWRHAL